jgi:hypothetical protein
MRAEVRVHPPLTLSQQDNEAPAEDTLIQQHVPPGASLPVQRLMSSGIVWADVVAAIRL